MAAYEKLAGIYDHLMADVDYQAWAGGIIKHLRQAGAVTAVDLACGTGNITLPLAAADFVVTGVDHSPDMLMAAQEKARGAGLRIPFIRQDIRQLQLLRPVDAAVMACDGFNYLLTPRDVERFFAGVYRALRPGGLIIFDISTRYKLEEVIGDAFFGMDEGDTAYLWRNRVDRQKRRLHMDITFFLREGEDRYRRFDETHTQQVYDTQDVLAALKRGGFEPLGMYGDLLAETPPSPDAHRVHFLAKRREVSDNG